MAAAFVLLLLSLLVGAVARDPSPALTVARLAFVAAVALAVVSFAVWLWRSMP